MPDPNTHTVGAQGFVWLSQSADLGILAPAKSFALSGRGVLLPKAGAAVTKTYTPNQAQAETLILDDLLMAGVDEAELTDDATGKPIEYFDLAARIVDSLINAGLVA